MTTIVQFAVLWFLRKLLPANVTFTVAFVVATSTHYLMNRFWALPSERRDTARQFMEYLAAVAISYVLNIAAFSIAHDVLKIGLMWSALAAVPLATLAVFLLLNFRVFRQRR